MSNFWDGFEKQAQSWIGGMIRKNVSKNKLLNNPITKKLAPHASEMVEQSMRDHAARGLKETRRALRSGSVKPGVEKAVTVHNPLGGDVSATVQSGGHPSTVFSHSGKSIDAKIPRGYQDGYYSSWLRKKKE